MLTRETPREIIEIGQPLSALHFLGHVSIVSYPVNGDFGEAIAEYLIVFGDGSRERVELRNGLNVARANQVYEGSRIDPIAIEAPVVVECAKDPDFNLSQVRYYRHVPTSSSRLVKEIQFRLAGDEERLPLLYALTIELDR